MVTRVLQPVWRTLKHAALDVCYGLDTASALAHGVAPRPAPGRMRRPTRG